MKFTKPEDTCGRTTTMGRRYSGVLAQVDKGKNVFNFCTGTFGALFVTQYCYLPG